jgi:hypothetical protein
MKRPTNVTAPTLFSRMLNWVFERGGTMYLIIFLIGFLTMVATLAWTAWLGVPAGPFVAGSVGVTGALVIAEWCS